MPSHVNQDQLTRLLRAADPMGDDPGLTPSDRHRMRRAVLSQVPEECPGLWPRLSPALSAAALLLIALIAATRPHTAPFRAPVLQDTLESRSTSILTPPDAPHLRPAGDSRRESRKIQFETPGGTLVVWVLNPSFPS